MAAIRFDKSDVEQNKVTASLGYLLFFLPLIACPGSKLGRHCANQGLILLIVYALGAIVLGLLDGLPLIGWLFAIAYWLWRVATAGVVALMMYCLIKNGDARELPFVGHFRLIR